MEPLGIVSMILFAYLLGSVPTGYLLGSLSGIDVRRSGSGNIGAANVARILGKRQGLLTLIGDAAKGFVPAFLSLQLGFGLAGSSLVGLASFLGHLYPVFLNFRGGKGVATAFGIFLSLAPMPALVLVMIFSVVVLASRIVSLASLAAAGVAPLALWVFSSPPLLVWLSLLISLLIVWRHRENIQRLLSGAEPRFGSRS